MELDSAGVAERNARYLRLARRPGAASKIEYLDTRTDDLLHPHAMQSPGNFSTGGSLPGLYALQKLCRATGPPFRHSYETGKPTASSPLKLRTRSTEERWNSSSIASAM